MELMNLDVSSGPPSAGDNGMGNSHISDEEEETSPTRGGPPSETSSQEWDKLTDPGTQTPAS
jgi:mitochondrial import receptor subunit TOM20